MEIDKQVWITFLVLIVAVVIFGTTGIDIYIQDMLYNFQTHTWALDRELQPWKFLFYEGIKKILIATAMVFLILLILSKRYSILHRYKQGFLLVVLSLVLIPSIVGIMKHSTNMPCPKNEIHYGGKMVKTAVWQSYAHPYKDMKHIACWPAGHASGGFALMSLFFLFKTKRNKNIALVFALFIGWSMGIYKMLIGDHFLSHTTITMLISWLVIVTLKDLLTKQMSSE